MCMYIAIQDVGIRVYTVKQFNFTDNHPIKERCCLGL